MKDKHRFSWKTKLRLCWDVMTRGRYDPRDYKTIHEEEQWEICEKRRDEMDACKRPRTEFHYTDDFLEQ